MYFKSKMSKKRSYVLVLFFLMLFSVSFSHNVFAYGPDYPVAEKPSLTDRVLSGVENIASIYSGAVKNQKAAFISSLRDTVLDFLGFTNEEPSLLPPPTTAPANSANPENSTKTFPNYVTNNYITNTYPSTIIKGGGGSTSGLARSVSRTNSIQDDTLTSLQNQIDGLPLGDIFSTSTTRGVFSSSATGLSYATSTGIFTLTSGYEIPLSASTTAWNTFYTTPSSRITAGTNLSWSSNTLNVSTTPTFASTTLSNFTAGSIPFFGTGGSLNQNNGNLFWDNTNARLGIGTTTPVGRLSIIPTSNTSTALYIQGLASQSGNVIDYRNSANTSLLNFDPSINGNAGMMTLNYLKAEGAAYISDIGAHNAANNLTIGPTDANGYSLIFRTNNQEKARFTSSGNFGIGTTTPTAKLQVVSTTEQQRIGHNSSNYFTTTVGATGIATFNAVGSGALFGFSDGAYITKNNSDQLRLLYDASNYLKINSDSQGRSTIEAFGTSPFVYIANDLLVGDINSSSGNDSINVNSNQLVSGGVVQATWGGTYALDVNGTLNISSTLYGSNGAYNVNLNSGLNTFDGTDGSTYTYLNNGSAAAEFVSYSGAVDVYIATGSTAIDATGDVLIEGDITVSSGYYYGDGQFLTGTSDSRLKHDIEELSASSTLEKVLSLKPVSFAYNEDASSTTRYGFVAQDIESVFPSLVVTNEKGFKGLYYSDFIGIITRAMQEMYARFEKVAAWFGGDGSKFDVQGDVCVDNVCVTKEQFKQIILDAGGTGSSDEGEEDDDNNNDDNTSTSTPPTDEVVPPDGDDEGEGEEVIIEEEPEPETVPEPQTEPETQPAPEEDPVI